MANVLETNKYIKPGVNVGQLLKANPAATTTFRRIPLYVGKGSKTLLFENKELIRGYIFEEVLTFTSTAQYKALLKFTANGVKSSTILKNSKDEILDDRVWTYVSDQTTGDFIGITINSAEYDSTETYIISYQSLDNSSKDFIGIQNIEKVLNMGVRVNGNNFKQEDFIIETQIGDFVEGSVVLNVTSNAGTGSLPQIHASSSYFGPTKRYHLIIDSNISISQPNLVSTNPGGGNAGVSLPSLNINNWTGSSSTSYSFSVTDITPDGNTVILGWSRNSPSASGFVTAKLGFEQEIEFIDGLTINAGDLTGYVLGDTVTFVVDLVVGQQLAVSWFTDEITGDAGQFLVNELNRTEVIWVDGINLVFDLTLSNYALGDAFTLEVINTGNIIWGYSLVGTELVQEANLSFDQTGAVTGERLVYYITLRQPKIQTVTSIYNIPTPGATPILVPSGDYVFIEGTPYIKFLVLPVGDIKVNFTFSNSPDHGQTYYLTAEARRPEIFYDNVIFLTKDNFRETVGYPTADNHLAIMAELALLDADVDTIAITQVRDSDKDGVYNTADFKRAIQATRNTKTFSDLIVLANISSIPDTIVELELRNDPFQQSETLGWFGYPALTEIGPQTLEVGTLLHYGGEVLQVSGESNSHGAHISVANTWAKKVITNRLGQQSEIILDGSFIAGTLAAMNAALPRPFSVLLRNTVPGFTDVHAYTDSEFERLGPYNFILLDKVGDLIRVLDVVTHDSFSPDTKNINAMNQKRWVTSVVREQMDIAVIGLVPPTKADGELLVSRALLSILRDLVLRGDVGSYQTAGGEIRDIDASVDTNIVRSDTDPTKYYMSYQYFLKYGIFRVNGLYTVDTEILFS